MVDTHTEELCRHAQVIRVFDPGRSYPEPWAYCVTVAERCSLIVGIFGSLMGTKWRRARGEAYVGALQGGVDTAGRVAIFAALWRLGYRRYVWIRKKPGGERAVRGPILPPETTKAAE